MLRFGCLLVLLYAFVLSACFSDMSTAYDANGEALRIINVYTDRHYPIDDSLYQAFTNQFGIKVNVVKGKSEDLLARIDKEGSATKADILFTSDVGRLHQAKKAGFFQPLPSFEALNILPSHLYDGEKYWVGVSKRSRVIVYHKERVNPNELSTYEDLVDEKWRGRIAVRSKGNVYNQSLLASIIAANGEEKALEWVKGMVENMYQSPKGNDRDQVNAVFTGKADLAIVNTYYLGQMLVSQDPIEREAAQSVGLFFPNQSDRGAHINVSGLGVLKASQRLEETQKFITYLLSSSVQQKFASTNFEYPVLPGVSKHEIVEAWGGFKSDAIPLALIGENNTKAIQLFDKGGWK